MKIFKQYPDLDKYFVTSDGTKFFTKTTADNHAKTLKNKAVKTVSKHVINDTDAGNEFEELIAKINKATSIDQVQELSKGVSDATVKKAVVNKIKALEKAIAEAKAKADQEAKKKEAEAKKQAEAKAKAEQEAKKQAEAKAKPNTNSKK